MIISSLTIK